MPEVRIETNNLTLQDALKILNSLLSKREKRSNPGAAMRLARLVSKASYITQIAASS